MLSKSSRSWLGRSQENNAEVNRIAYSWTTKKQMLAKKELLRERSHVGIQIRLPSAVLELLFILKRKCGPFHCVIIGLPVNISASRGCA